MSKWINADMFEARMYHEAFENDASYNESNPMAKWDSGLWIRYKMFENLIADAPSIDIVRCNDCKSKEDCPLRLIANLEYCSIGEKE